MKLQIIGALSRQDLWVISKIRECGPVTVCDEHVVEEYANTFNKRVRYIDQGTRIRCEAWEKKLYSLFERHRLVRQKRKTPYTKNMEVWHYGLPGRDDGKLYNPWGKDL